MPARITTAEQLLRAQHLGPCELIRGELRMLDYNGVEHGRVAATLLSRIGTHVAAHRLGAVLAPTGFVLSRNPDTVRAPDGAFLRADRMNLGPGYVEGAQRPRRRGALARRPARIRPREGRRLA